MKKSISIVAALFCVAAVFQFASGAEKWKNLKEKNGISVSIRPVKGSDIDEFKGVGLVDAPLELVAKVIEDVPGLAEWMPDCVTSVLVEDRGNGETVIYQEIKTPWPLKNRDFVIVSKTKRQKNKIVYSDFITTHPKFPAKKGKVRMTELTAKWVLTGKVPGEVKSGRKHPCIYRKQDKQGNAL